MKKLLKYFKDYRLSSFLGPCFKLIEALLELTVPMFVAVIIDEAIPSGEVSQILRYIAIMFGVGLTGFIFSITAQYHSARAAIGVTRSMGNDLFKHMMHLPKAQRDDLTPASMVTRMTSDLFQIQSAINIFFRLFLRSPFIVLGSLVMAMQIDLRMTGYFVAMILLLTFVVVGSIYLTTPLHSKIRRELDRLVTLTREQIQGIRVIRAFRQENRERTQFQKQNEILTADQIKVGKLSNFTNPLTYIVVNSVLILVIWQGGHFVNEGSLQQGQLVALVNYLLAILIELVKIAMFVLQINRGLTSANRVIDVLERPVESITFDNPILKDNEIKNKLQVKATKDSSVLFNDVSFKYPDASEASLRDVNVSFSQGDFIGITGSTGSGKSTLLSLLTKTYDPSAGQVSFNPEQFDTSSRQALREQISVVPQSATLFQGTIRSNLLQGHPSATDEQLWQALEDAQASDFVREKQGGLDAMVEAFGRNFSGGQRQRLTIARALIKPAKILVLDAATSALDYVTEANFQKVLREKYQELTIIMVSERTHSIKEADQIIVLDQGRQIGADSHEDLLKNNAVYREIHESQQVLEVN